jgi:hypothetical protein
LDANVDRGKNISEDIKTSAKESISNYELRQHKLSSEEDGCKILENRQIYLYCIFRVKWMEKPEQR